MLARPQYDLASREATVSGHAVQPTTRWPWPEEMNPTTARITGWSYLDRRVAAVAAGGGLRARRGEGEGRRDGADPQSDDLAHQQPSHVSSTENAVPDEYSRYRTSQP